ncbi:MAG: radical SAM family heme chaperone HemW [Planctomycetota bacterium]|nr:radical SAM family heme chaperone HemW [Planctomycetota bacterium]MDA1105048.1 radical SAM family heme chaperone HemW [Planctomycetota bacterium]
MEAATASSISLPQHGGGLLGIAAIAPTPGAHAVSGLYVHVPFCRHKCHYCDFYSFVDRDGRQEAYVAALERDIEASRAWLTEPLSTIFVGGGTPTLLEPLLLQRAMEAIGSLPRAADAEWTVEANPETVDAARADALVRSGVTRVSIGAQSFHPRHLETLERHHDPASVGRAAQFLRAAGIEDINLDLIFGIPGSSLEDWSADLEQVLGLSPTHVSCYNLTFEPNTPLEAKLRQGRIVKMDEELELGMLELARSILEGAGYTHYEISNWSKPGHECRHNLLYWLMGSWWGLGPSATAQVGRRRWKVVPRLGDWLAGPALGGAVDLEVPDEDTWVGEAFMMGLRLIDGMPRDRAESLLKMGLQGERRRRVIEQACARGHMAFDERGLRFSMRGLPLANEVIRELLAGKD